jgi:hypothetical protein
LVALFNGEYKMATPRKTNKTLINTNVKDLVIYGNGDVFKLLSKASSVAERWMKSTKVMQIEGVGCLVQVTTQQGDNVAEALEFVPNVELSEDESGVLSLVAMKRGMYART